VLNYFPRFLKRHDSVKAIQTENPSVNIVCLSSIIFVLSTLLENCIASFSGKLIHLSIDYTIETLQAMRISEFAGLENDGLEFGRLGKEALKCKLLNYMDIGCNTYIKVWLKSRTTVSRATM